MTYRTTLIQRVRTDAAIRVFSRVYDLPWSVQMEMKIKLNEEVIMRALNVMGDASDGSLLVDASEWYYEPEEAQRRIDLLRGLGFEEVQ